MNARWIVFVLAALMHQACVAAEQALAAADDACHSASSCRGSADCQEAPSASAG